MVEEALNVLLIDNDRRVHNLVRDMLAESGDTPFTLECEDSLGTGLERIEARPFDALLLDLNLPDSLGIDTLKAVCTAAPRVPVIVLSSIEDSRQVAPAVLRNGAQDYLVKGNLNGDTLSRSVIFAIERKKGEDSFLSDATKKTADRLFEGGAEDLTNMIEMAAHELRHPATILKGYATLLRDYGDELDPETARDALDGIDQASNRLTHLINNLLDTSRIERRKLKLAYREVDPNALLTRAVEEMRARGVEVELNVLIHGDEREFRLDPEKVKDAVSILLDNAVKFSPGGGEVDLWCEDRGDAIVFSVADRGPGVPEEDRENVFGRFFRVESDAHNSKSGIGLGLYIAKTYVLAHGGWIMVSPREGGGSVFSFGVPANPIEGGFDVDPDESPLDRLLRRFEF